MIRLIDPPSTGHDFSIAAGNGAWRDLISRPHAPILVAVALVASAAVAVFPAGGVFDATAAISILAPAGERITDNVRLALAPALAVAGAIAAAVLTRLRDNVLRARDSAGQQTADTHGGGRLKQPSPPSAGGSQLEKGIERLVVHAVSPSLAQPHGQPLRSQPAQPSHDSLDPPHSGGQLIFCFASQRPN
jgi:hypothetical protein